MEKLCIEHIRLCIIHKIEDITYDECHCNKPLLTSLYVMIPSVSLRMNWKNVETQFYERIGGIIEHSDIFNP